MVYGSISVLNQFVFAKIIKLLIKLKISHVFFFIIIPINV